MPASLTVIVAVPGLFILTGFLAAWFSHKWND